MSIRRALLLVAIAAVAWVLIATMRGNTTQSKATRPADFNAWLELEKKGGATLEDGCALAHLRRVELLKLIQEDPEKALTQAVPLAVREKLPNEILAELETPLAGVGDYSVCGAMRAPGGPPVEVLRKSVSVNGQTYSAHVYGRRQYETTKNGIPLSGIALDGHAALHEDALRVLPAEEVRRMGKPVTAISTASNESGTKVPAFAEFGDHIYQFASANELAKAESRLRSIEEVPGPLPAGMVQKALSSEVDAMTVRSANTEGPKTILVIRVDFSDLTGDPVNGNSASTVYTQAVTQNIADTLIAPYYKASSFGVTTQTFTVSTKVYRLPNTAASYAVATDNNDGLHKDARALAAADYPVTTFDRVAVLFSNLSNFPGSKTTYGGLGQLGGKFLWVNSFFDFRVMAHELGHTYGLYHANLWKVTDGNPISTAGTSTEYLDEFDTMGENFVYDTNTDFNPWCKSQLNWLPAAGVQTVTANGVFRVTRIDGAANSGTLALKIVKDSTRNYWIGVRRKITSNSAIQNGAYIIWGYNKVQQSDLLNLTTPGGDYKDAPLALNAKFFDPVAKVTITPIANGGTAGNEYMDIDVKFGDPVSSGTTTTTKVSNATAPFGAAAQNVTLSATVTAATGTVGVGTVSYGVFSGTTQIGATVTSGTVTAGAASAVYSLPGGTAAGTYVIQATYNASGTFANSTDSTATLTVGSASFSFSSPATATPSTGNAGDIIQFTATASDTKATLAWDFGDGSTGSGSSVSHTYVAQGSYSAKATATLGTAKISSTVAVTINPLGTGNSTGTIKLTKVAVTLDFANLQSTDDTIAVTGTLAIAQGFVPKGKRLVVSIGGVLRAFDLDDTASGSSGTDTFTMKLTQKSGVVKKQTAKFSIMLTGNFKVAMDKIGFSNATNKKAVSLPIDVGISVDGVFSKTTKTEKYTSVMNVSGKAK